MAIKRWARATLGAIVTASVAETGVLHTGPGPAVPTIIHLTVLGAAVAHPFVVEFLVRLSRAPCGEDRAIRKKGQLKAVSGECHRINVPPRIGFAVPHVNDRRNVCGKAAASGEAACLQDLARFIHHRRATRLRAGVHVRIPRLRSEIERAEYCG